MLLVLLLLLLEDDRRAVDLGEYSLGYKDREPLGRDEHLMSKRDDDGNPADSCSWRRRDETRRQLAWRDWVERVWIWRHECHWER